MSFFVVYVAFAFASEHVHLPVAAGDGVEACQPAVAATSRRAAAYNALRAYFDETPVATVFGGTMSTAPLNYLQIFADDFQYAEKNTGTKVTVSKTLGPMSAQDLLNLASEKLLEIGEPTLP